jgi:ABC-type antimicrobial peptide transport system permease subunit
MIIEIALGIVAGFILLALLPAIVVALVWLIRAAVVLALVGAAAFGLYWLGSQIPVDTWVAFGNIAGLLFLAALAGIVMWTIAGWVRNVWRYFTRDEPPKLEQL